MTYQNWWPNVLREICLGQSTKISFTNLRMKIYQRFNNETFSLYCIHFILTMSYRPQKSPSNDHTLKQSTFVDKWKQDSISDITAGIGYVNICAKWSGGLYYFLLSKDNRFISKVNDVISRVICCLILSVPHKTFRRH